MNTGKLNNKSYYFYLAKNNSKLTPSIIQIASTQSGIANEIREATYRQYYERRYIESYHLFTDPSQQATFQYLGT